VILPAEPTTIALFNGARMYDGEISLRSELAQSYACVPLLGDCNVSGLLPLKTVLSYLPDTLELHGDTSNTLHI
jgi:hypothetical protein